MVWDWPIADEGRVKRAKAVKYNEINASGDSPSARAAGSAAEDYSVTFSSCTCADFSISARKNEPQPCKHMIALAMKCGILNENGLTPAQQLAADRQFLRDLLARAYGYYYLFGESFISDAEYDAAKARLASLQVEQ